MQTTKLDIKTARNISLITVLNHLGHQPKKTRNNDVWFISPFRKEHTPSFKINVSINKWFDFGEQIGGNAVDFVTKYFNYNIPQALDFLSNFESFSFQPSNNMLVKNKESRIEILDVKEKIEHPALIEYLESRKISLNIATVFCEEIHYKVNNKNYFALGMSTISGSWAIRNKYFKGITSQDISYFGIKSFLSEIGCKVLMIYEGMFDLLSTGELYTSTNREYAPIRHDSIVLNSVGNYEKLRPIISNYDTVFVMVDNDNAGDDFMKKIKKEYGKTIRVIDHRDQYKGFKDLNEYLINQ